MSGQFEQIDEDDNYELFVPSEIFPVTGVPRFDFQRGAVHNSKGFVLNCGCNEDPAGLKASDPERVINVDLHAFDEGMNRANLVDKVFDITDAKAWEENFAPNSAELVVFGDVLEHMGPDQMVDCLRNAHRVAPRVCITIPEDHRIPDDAKYVQGIYNEHVTVATEPVLRDVLVRSRWKPFAWLEGVDWGFTDERGQRVLGHCIEAHRI